MQLCVLCGVGGAGDDAPVALAKAVLVVVDGSPSRKANGQQVCLSSLGVMA